MESSLKSSERLTLRNGIARKRSIPRLISVKIYLLRQVPVGRRGSLALLPSLYPNMLELWLGRILSLKTITT